MPTDDVIQAVFGASVRFISSREARYGRTASVACTCDISRGDARLLEIIRQATKKIEVFPYVHNIMS